MFFVERFKSVQLQQETKVNTKNINIIYDSLLKRVTLKKDITYLNSILFLPSAMCGCFVAEVSLY